MGELFFAASLSNISDGNKRTDRQTDKLAYINTSARFKKNRKILLPEKRVELGSGDLEFVKRKKTGKGDEFLRLEAPL